MSQDELNELDELAQLADELVELVRQDELVRLRKLADIPFRAVDLMMARGVEDVKVKGEYL